MHVAYQKIGDAGGRLQPAGAIAENGAANLQQPGFRTIGQRRFRYSLTELRTESWGAREILPSRLS